MQLSDEHDLLAFLGNRYTSDEVSLAHITKQKSFVNYFGEVNENKQPHGRGVIFRPNGNMRIGHFANGTGYTPFGRYVVKFGNDGRV